MQDLQLYSYSSWEPCYAKYTFSSVVVDLTQEFVDFLQEGGIVVSSSSKALPQRSKPTEVVVEGVDYDPDDTYSSDDSKSASDNSSDSQEQLPWCEQFLQLHAEIESAIEQLGGQVAPKLNWSSPTDALWISSYNSLKCCNADQVILLLKSSDRIMHDLEQLQAARQQQQQQQQQQTAPPAACGRPLSPQLVLRKWHDLLPEREFRCFVQQHTLVAISQRDVSQHFPQLSMTGELNDIKHGVKTFHTQHIGNSFPVDSYVFDVYVPASSSSIKIMDFNPVCHTTSPLLFNWEELPYTHMHTTDNQHHQQQSVQQEPAAQQEYHAGDSDVELRVVSQSGSIMPGARAATGMPLDMLGLQDSFEEVLRTMQQQEKQQQQQQQQQQ